MSSEQVRECEGGQWWWSRGIGMCMAMWLCCEPTEALLGIRQSTGVTRGVDVGIGNTVAGMQ